MMPFQARKSVTAVRHALPLRSLSITRPSVFKSHVQLSVVVLENPWGSIRSFSAGTEGNKQKKGDSKEPSPFQRFKAWLEPFTNGAKGLSKENIEAWKLRSKVNKGTELSRREAFVLRQAPRDLIKCFPTLLLFCVPMLGYVAPVIATQFPKQLLSWHFWTPEQRKQFFQQDIQSQIDQYPLIRKKVAELVPDEAELNRTNRLLSPVELTKYVEVFREDAQIGLSSMGPADLKKLGTALNVVPFGKLGAIVLPTTYIGMLLRNKGKTIRFEDHLLLNEGVEDMTLAELEFACYERGLNVQFGNKEELSAALNAWLEIYDNTTEPELPVSLLLHAPMLVEVNKSESK